MRVLRLACVSTALFVLSSTAFAQLARFPQDDAPPTPEMGDESMVMDSVIMDDGCCDPCEDPCDSGCACYLWGPSEAWTLSSADDPITIGGWISAGYHDGDTTLFNSRPDNFNWHQNWLYAEKAADGSRGLDWGFRSDLMYGIDADDTQAFGNTPGRWDYLNGFDHGAYGWAIPQLYGEVAAGDWSVIVGHFFTLVGYEVVPAPDNFFYSHALTMYNSEPFTHTGALATYSGFEGVELYGGWTLGWDTGFDRFNDGSSFLGGASVDVTDDLNVTYISTIGNFGKRGDGYTQSIVANYSITDSLNYIFHSDLVSTTGTWDDDTSVFVFGEADDQYSINQYLIYTLSDCWAVGARGEWWKSDGVSFYEITYGVNYRPMANFIFRPEVRHQWSPTAAADFADSDIFGMDGILTF